MKLAIPFAAAAVHSGGHTIRQVRSCVPEVDDHPRCICRVVQCVASSLPIDDSGYCGSIGELVYVGTASRQVRFAKPVKAISVDGPSVLLPFSAQVFAVPSSSRDHACPVVLVPLMLSKFVHGLPIAVAVVVCRLTTTGLPVFGVIERVAASLTVHYPSQRDEPATKLKVSLAAPARQELGKPVNV